MQKLRVSQIFVVLVLLCLIGTGAGMAQDSADLDRSGFVNAQDQLLFLQQWQEFPVFIVL